MREDLLPVAAYFFGRGLDLTTRDARRLGVTILASASAVAAFGLVDVYAIPLSWWRSSGAPAGSSTSSGSPTQGLSDLPENFVYNLGNGHRYRRLVSVFLSPLATSYMLVTALLLSAAWRLQLRPRLWLWLPTTALLYAGSSGRTRARPSSRSRSASSSIAALRPQGALWLSRLGGRGVVLVGLAFVKAYPHIGAETASPPRPRS